MKNFLKRISFFLIAFLMIGCQKDELPIAKNDLSQKAKSWYEENHDQKFNENPNFYGSPDWNNYFEVENDIYIPLISKSSVAKSNIKLDDLKNKVYAKSYLVLTKNNNDYIESLKVFLSQDQSKLSSVDEMMKLSRLEYRYSPPSNEGIISNETLFFQSKNEKINNSIAQFDHQQQISVKTGCETYYVIKTTSVNGNPVHIEILYSYELCGGGDGNGGGGDGNGGSLPTVHEIDALEWPDADCSSWEYANLGLGIKGAAVIGMSNLFLSGYYDSTGYGYEGRRVNMPTLYFTALGGWTNGRAATVTARVINQARRKTEAWYKKNRHVHGDILGLEWLKNMKDAMKKIGGSVSTNNLHNMQNPAPFVSNFFGSSNCG